MAGIDAETIAEVLIMLGRKKHTHRYKLREMEGNPVLERMIQAYDEDC